MLDISLEAAKTAEPGIVAQVKSDSKSQCLDCNLELFRSRTQADVSLE